MGGFFFEFGTWPNAKLREVFKRVEKIMWGLLLNRYFLVAVAVLAMLMLKKRNKDWVEVDVIKNLPDGIEPSISLHEANLIAHDLQVAMDRYGTDNRTIKGVVERVNAADWALINNAFGYKTYSIITGAREFELFGYNWNKRHNLKTWLRSELSRYFNAKIYSRVKTLYEANGVVF